MDTQKLDLSTLTAEQLQAELKKRENQKEKDRKAYKDMVNEQLPKIVGDIMKASTLLSLTKLNAFESLKTLLDFKTEVYDVKATQQTHTFSDDSGNVVTYGFRTLEKWGDTVNEGISKVNKYLESLAKDEETAQLVGMINNLLKKDAKGNLKASRVLELIRMSEESTNPDFIDGVNIIRKSYKPERSKFFIEAQCTDAEGKKVNIPLSISAVDFPEDTDIDSIFPVDERYLAKKELKDKQ